MALLLFWASTKDVFVKQKCPEVYSKTCVKRPLKNKQNKGIKTIGSLIKVESIAECSLGAFCNTFDLH